MTLTRFKRLFRLQRTIVVLLFLSFLCGMVLGISLVTNTDLGSGILSLFSAEKQGPLSHNYKPAVNHGLQKGNNLSPRRFGHGYKFNESLIIPDEGHHGNDAKPFPGNQADPKQTRDAFDREKPRSNKELRMQEVGVTGLMEKFPAPNYNVHIFYYPWYGNPKHDEGKWLHWNHGYLPHWNKDEARKWPIGRHAPPDDIGSNFYPELGPYSSRDPKVMEEHMKQIRSSGIGEYNFEICQ